MSKEKGVNSSQLGQTVEAIDFELPGQQTSQEATTPTKARAITKERSKWWHSQFNLMLLVFGLLIATALLTIVAFPEPEYELDTIGSDETIPTNQSQNNLDQAAPWSQQQQAEARTKSQNILAELLKNKAELETKNVEEWESEQFDAAMELAKLGDEQYQQQNYAAAIGHYQTALGKTKKLLNLLPEMVAEKIKLGNQAISEGKAALAREVFAQAIELDSNSLEAKAGLERAKNLDQVLDLLAQAQSITTKYDKSNDLNDLLEAKAKLEKAHSLDSQLQAVSGALEQINSQINDVQFKKAMSKAYAALFANRYQTARREFSNALKFKPSDPNALAAIQQATAGDKSSSLASLLKSAKQFEKNEEWASAVVNYQEVLRRDSNQITAKLGNIRSSARSQLDQQLDQALSDPLALAKPKAKQRAIALLADAKAIKQQGSRLKQQIQQLDNLLQQATVKLNLRLVSDGVTQITLKRDGAKPVKLGQFKQQSISLVMGRYVIVGQRQGYRDERKVIELSAKDTMSTVIIKCQVAVNSGLLGG